MDLNRRIKLQKLKNKLEEIKKGEGSKENDIESAETVEDLEQGYSLTRRKFMKTAGLMGAGGVLASSAAGLRILGDNSFSISSSTSEPRFRIEEGTLIADDVKVDDINGVKVAHDASEIQPAIDELAKPGEDGAQGGIVKLLPKKYYPDTTIWLKKGVMLEGSQASRFNKTESNQPIQPTIISTGKMDDTPTHWHEPGGDLHNSLDLKHPHYPVIMNYRTPPLELADREPTQEEKLYWGHGCDLKDLIIDANAKNTFEINFTVDDVDEEYFNVYDAVFLSRSNGWRTINVETRGFLGYGLISMGCRGFRDMGGLWRGGATDLHHAPVRCQTTYDPDVKIYPQGAMDFEAAGPPPVVKMHLRGGHRIFSGGWSNARIESTGYRFKVSKERWKNDEGDPQVRHRWSKAVVVQDGHGNFNMEGYTIKGHGDTVNGVDVIEGGNTFDGVHVKNVDAAFGQRSRNGANIQNCRITEAVCGLRYSGKTARIHNLEINADTGIEFTNGRQSVRGTMSGVKFNCKTGVKGTNQERRGPVVFNYPDFSNCDTPFDEEGGRDGLKWGDWLHINNPTGLTDEEHPLK